MILKNASVCRLLFLSMLFLGAFSCRVDQAPSDDISSETTQLFCVSASDSSGRFSVFATIGSNQTKITETDACKSVNIDQYFDKNTQLQVRSILGIGQTATKAVAIIQTGEFSYTIIVKSKLNARGFSLATYQDGKFYFGSVE